MTACSLNPTVAGAREEGAPGEGLHDLHRVKREGVRGATAGTP